MRLGRGAIDAVFGADMHFAIADLKPESTAAGEGLGFVDFRESEDAAIEGAGPRFFAARDGELDVVDAEDHSHQIREVRAAIKSR